MQRRKWYWGVCLLLMVFNIYVWTFPAVCIVQILESGDDAYFPALSWSFQSHSKLPAAMSGSGERETRLLYRDYRAVHGHGYKPRDQVGPSCVGHATAAAIDFLGAVEVATGRRSVPPPSKANGAWLYAVSREFGGLSPMSAGSHCRLAVRAANEVGFLYNENFIFTGYDLTTERYERVWRTGTPAELDPFATNYITGYFHLRNYEDVRDAISQGMPVVIGSSVGFGRTNRVIYRDSDGFLNTPLFRFRGKYWLHAMSFIGVSDVGREGVLCLNSWGTEWVKGPQRFGDEPLGSFWIDKETVNRMCSHGDCYAIWGLRRVE